MATKILNIKELATTMVGDGKKPNRYFVTIAYGWYKPHGEDTDMEQAPDSFESCTLFFTDYNKAVEVFDSFKLKSHTNKKPTGEEIGQVVMEDRLTGTVMEKYIEESSRGVFFESTYY